MSEKHLVCQGATVYCDKSLACNSPATAVPLNITSQTLVEMNGGKLAATDKDNSVANMNFGICNDPKYSNAKPPCMAKVIWQKMHEEVDITEAGMKFLTEKSEAVCNVCSVPGKIRIAFHGQVATLTADNFNALPKTVQFALCPVSREKENDRIEFGQKDGRLKRVLVKEVKGNTTAHPFEKVIYKVTAYNEPAVPDNVRESIRWMISVDGKEESVSETGETLELLIKSEWTGKDVTVMPYLRKPDDEISVKTKIVFEPHIRIIITNLITGYTIQGLKGIDFYTSDPAVIVPTYKVNVVNYDETCKEGIVEFSFDVTRDAWYCIGKENGKYKIINRAFVPANWAQNLYGAFWIPSYPRFSKLGAFVLTRFGKKELPAKPLLTQKCLNGKYIDSYRKDERIATDIMIHIGGTYEVLGYDYLGGSYGCFGFIPKEDIYKTSEEARKASLNDDYDDQTSNSEWINVTNKILQLSFNKNKNIKVLIEYRDEKTNYTPQIIYEE